MSPFGHKPDPDLVSAKALILSPPFPTTGLQSVDIAIELPDGHYTFGSPTWSISASLGSLHVGTWVPVKLSPDEPNKAELDSDLVPDDSDVVAVIREALGGPKVDPVAPMSGE